MLYSRAKEVSAKESDTDLVTATDRAVEKMLFDGLRLVWWR
jgi:fructose-1,6-bisphosphatase/inositol monophosphatase family enzyme